MSGLPFAGIHILDFTWFAVGPVTTKYLADYGADVVRIESAARLVPSSLSAGNFLAVLKRYPVLVWVDNSLIIAVVAVVLTVFINLLCGYTFAKFRFPGRNILFFAILGALMVPIQVILVPEFLIVSWLGLLNTHLGVILPRAAEAFGVAVTDFPFLVGPGILRVVRNLEAFALQFPDGGHQLRH